MCDIIIDNIKICKITIEIKKIKAELNQVWQRCIGFRAKTIVRWCRAVTKKYQPSLQFSFFFRIKHGYFLSFIPSIKVIRNVIHKCVFFVVLGFSIFRVCF